MVVLVDNNQESRAALERTLVAQGYSVRSVTSLDEARQLNGGSSRLPLLLVGYPGTPAHPLSMREVERIAIEDALRANNGNRTHAARQLGISLRKLQYRLKEYGGQPEPETRPV
jgi:DNA-binding NtrC family response regulator